MTDVVPRYPIRQLIPALAAALRGPGADAPSGLAWRVKQVQRQDWPTTMEQDAQIKRGYKPTQALRLLAALSLLDAGLGPTQAVVAASDNENTLLGIMAGSLAEPRASGRVLALIRPRAIDGSGGDDAAGDTIVVEPIDIEDAGKRIVASGAGPAWLIVDLATQCRALLDHLELDRDALAIFAAAMHDGTRATLAGRGHVPTRHPRGDRYLTRKTSRRADLPLTAST